MTATAPAQPATALREWLKLRFKRRILAFVGLLGALIYACCGGVEGTVPVAEVQLRGLIARPSMKRSTEPLSFSTAFVARVRTIRLDRQQRNRETTPPPPLWTSQQAPLASLVIEADTCASIGFVMAAPAKETPLPEIRLFVTSAARSDCPALVTWSEDPKGDDSKPVGIGPGDFFSIAFDPPTGSPLLSLFPKRPALGFEGARPVGKLNWNGVVVGPRPAAFTSRWISLEDVELLVLGPTDGGCTGQRDSVPWALCLKYRSAPFAPDLGNEVDWALLELKAFVFFWRWTF